MARARAEEEIYDEEEEEEDVDYTTCPICVGGRRNCRYCDGYGDVHPDDVDAILAAYSSDRRLKMIFAGVGAFLFTGVLVAVFMVVRANVADQAGANGENPDGVATNPDGTPVEGVSKSKKKNLPAGYSKKVKEIIVDMRIDLRVRAYDDVIRKGTAALSQTQDEIQRKNLQDMIDRARKAKGG